MQRIFSNSSLSCFEKCPKQFHYRYVEKIPVETESIEAFVGKRVHEILERLYRFVADGRVPALPAVLNRFRHTWEEHFDPERIRIVRTETPPDSYRQLGERCLENYYRRNYPFDAEETLGLEEHLRFDLDDAGQYPLRGFVDRIARGGDGALEIHDYKTGRRVPRQSELDRDRQLALYQIGLTPRYGDSSEVRLVWHYVANDRVRTSRRSSEQLERLGNETMQLIDAIRAEQQFEPQPSALCRWCEFEDRCPASGSPRRQVPAKPAPKSPDLPLWTRG